MWVVAKIKIKSFNIFKKNLSEKIGSEVQFYCPKVEYYKYFGNKLKKFEKLILENYIFCYHKKFKETNSINEFRFVKGLEYFLHGHQKNQNQILKFIDYCKSFEDAKGYLMQSFFMTMITKKVQFLSGPFTNMLFDVIEKQKHQLKILVGNFVTTVPNNKNYLYRSVL